MPALENEYRLNRGQYIYNSRSLKHFIGRIKSVNFVHVHVNTVATWKVRTRFSTRRLCTSLLSQLGLLFCLRGLEAARATQVELETFCRLSWTCLFYHKMALTFDFRMVVVFLIVIRQNKYFSIQSWIYWNW